MFSIAFRRTAHLQRLAQNARSLETASAASTVNPAEIAHFSRLSSLWWDERGEFALLHRMNPVRVQYIREKLIERRLATRMEQSRDVLRGLDVLDVGCGGGLLSESLARMGARTLGIDASESNIGIASLHASRDPQLSSRGSSCGGSLDYRMIAAEDLLKEVKQYDIVCSMEVIEHVDNPASFLATCAQLVKPGGHLFLSTIARTPLSYLLTILAAEYVLRKVAVGTHTYSKFVNPSELVNFFQKYLSPPLDGGSIQRPWITRTYEHGLPTRSEAEVRGLVYVPWSGNWSLMPRSATQWGAAECNYLFWVRKPL
ncbi:S-adenosyl-L-methionine-dependent methyltransferase [Phlebopus sp. FC_14]|nr:S-adenosyl-L-methionine-dependent methyltransferase [Phlebopus sp. FC_14]